MFSNPRWQRFALLLNLAGTALLFYSFQATSSDFRLVTTRSQGELSSNPSGLYAICINDFTLLETNAKGGVIVGGKGCPDWAHSKATAVVNIEHPLFEGLGFIVLLAGFFIQYLSVPHPQTMADLRRQLKLLKAQEKATHKKR